ncbi:MAG: hypothetical protein IPH13_21880 [Planctomycetes bacterium]|nr:hypothetical protein [Planctomycetota bacterium]
MIALPHRFARAALFVFVALCAPPTAFAAGGSGIRLLRPLAPSLQDDARIAMARLNDVAERPFSAVADELGFATRIVDGRVVLERDHANAVRELLTQYAHLFGYDARLEARVVVRGSRAHVTFERLGVRVLGARGVVRFDGDRITDAAFTLPRNVSTRGRFALTDSGAMSSGRAAATELRTRRLREPVGRWREGRVERVWRARADGLHAAMWVEALPDFLAQEQALVVDGDDGACLDVVDLACSGTGLYPTFGNATIPFTTGGGSGRVFKNVKDARAGKAKSASLAPLGRGVPELSLPDGLLVGAFADVYPATGLSPFSPSHVFPFGPFGDDAEMFDHVNVYFHITQFRNHLEKVLGPDLSGGHSLPVVVNFDATDPNAFFSPTSFDSGRTTGWLAFLQVPAGGDEADLSRDPTVVAHEYTHAWLWFELLDFSGSLNDPARAVNEAFADWFSLCFHGDEVIGRYTDDVFPGYGIARDLADDDHFPETTLEASALPWSNDGLPEEHRNGEVFGSFLMDVRRALGTKAAEQFVFAALPAMPRTIGEAGIATYDAGVSLDASQTFFSACVSALFASATTGKQRGAVLGASAARGITNTNDAMILALTLESEPKAKLTIPSAIVLPGNEHVFAVTMPETGSLSIKLAAAKGSTVLPDFTITDEFGGTSAVTETKAKAFSKDGRVLTQKGLTKNLGAGAMYLIRVSGTGGTVGRYTLTIDA